MNDTSSIPPLEELYLRQLRDLHSAETQSIPALVALAEAAGHFALREALADHLEDTREQAERVERLLDDLDADKSDASCEMMAGLVRDARRLLAEPPPEAALDPAIVAAAQRIEHYEIAGYGCARTYAALLGDTEAAAVLQDILDQESDSDLRLTEVAAKLNVQALATAQAA